jgi:shikimate kinase
MGNLFLVGMPGAGKTTVGRALARRLDMNFLDTDKEIIARTGVPIATIFEIEGEAGFRERESTVLSDLVQRDDLVLATGGGSILKEQNRTLLREKGTVIYLRAKLEHLWQRTHRDTSRPLLQTDNPRATLQALLDVRDPLYRETAHLVVDTGAQSISHLTNDIVMRLEQMRTHT